MATNFQVGDRVTYHLTPGGMGEERIVGFLGTIMEVRAPDTYEVEFDNKVEHFTAYTSARHSKKGHGWVTNGNRLTKVYMNKDDVLAALVNRRITEETYRELTKDGS